MAVVKSVTIDLGVRGDAAAKAKLDAITARADELKKAFPDFTVKIDTAAAAAKLQVFRAQLADVTKDRTANVKVKVDDSELAKLANKLKGAGGPWWLGPALLGTPGIATLGGVGLGAAAGLGGAAVAGGGALAAFGAIAKPVLADTLKAQQQINTAQNAFDVSAGRVHVAITTNATDAQAATAALKGLTPAQQQVEQLLGVQGTSWADLSKAQQDAAVSLLENKGALKAMLPDQVAALKNLVAFQKIYADLSPQQIALSKQLGAMAQAWQNLKAAQTPVVAGALQPWLKSVTDLTGQLGPIIASVSPVIQQLGAGFDALINSPQFKVFRDFIMNTGTAAVNAVGGTLIDFIDAFIILLPKFNPLIEKTIGWIAGLGPAVLRWAASKKTADQITAFMAWFNTNGPVVGGLLKNIAGALKNLAPGLTSGGITELKVISDFFGFIAKLPKGLATPLAEVAGALLILNKLGVVSVGLKLLGMDAAAAAAGGGAAGLWGKMLPGVRLVSGALVAVVGVDMILKSTSSGAGGANWFDNPFGGSNPSHPVKGSKPNALSSWDQLGRDIEHDWDMTWRNTITRTAQGFHDLAGWFDTGRHWVAARTDLAGHDIVNWWNITWNNTISRAARGFHDLAGWFDTGRHDTARDWDLMRHDAAAAWDLIWNNTVGRVQRGVADVMGWIGTLPGRIRGVFTGAGGWLLQAGKDVIQGFWNGLTAIWGSVTSWVSGIANWIRAHKGPIGLDQSLLYPAGHAMMSGFLSGLKAGFGPVGSFVGGLASWIASQVSAAGGKLAGGVINLVKGAFGVVSGSGTSFNVQQWIPTIIQALQMEGLPGNLLGDVLVQMQSESGGNARAINLTDINAQLGTPSKGLMQVIQPTFDFWHWPGTSWDIYDPLANIAAALNYGAHGKGFGSGMGQIGSGHGYASGTSGALPGWAWVGERGPELLRFRGGEQVIPAGAGRGGGGDMYVTVHVHAPVGSSPREIGQVIAAKLAAFKKGGGWIYKPGGF